MRQEFFTASRGDGAQLEGKKIRVSTQRTLEGSLDRHGLSVPHGPMRTCRQTISPC
jgi:fructose-1,6-bisphosphatase/inositol monophosphatase family enzyme